MDSFIYRDMTPEQATECGYFKPATPWAPIADVNHISKINGGHINIDENTVICYYPGAFGYFHDGHYECVMQACDQLSEITDNYVVVIGPANSEYTVQKYGFSSFSSNKSRLDRIQQWRSAFTYEKARVVIDLNPMLNHISDQNFTDLIKDFAGRNVPGGFNALKNTPYVIGGKDRDFRAIEKYTDKLKCLFIEQYGEYSTSSMTPVPFKKKKIILRCHTLQESLAFKEYLGEFYTGMEVIYISAELQWIGHVLSTSGNTVAVTNCKDYAKSIPYKKLSRYYEHPLATPYHRKADVDAFMQFYREKGANLVVDSDTYSGSTSNMLLLAGVHHFIAKTRITNTNDVELLDIDDFRDDTFRYPFHDLSSKCSLPAFTPEMHERIEKLRFHLQLLEL